MDTNNDRHESLIGSLTRKAENRINRLTRYLEVVTEAHAKVAALQPRLANVNASADPVAAYHEGNGRRLNSLRHQLYKTRLDLSGAASYVQKELEKIDEIVENRRMVMSTVCPAQTYPSPDDPELVAALLIRLLADDKDDSDACVAGLSIYESLGKSAWPVIKASKYKRPANPIPKGSYVFTGRSIHVQVVESSGAVCTRVRNLGIGASGAFLSDSSTEHPTSDTDAWIIFKDEVQARKFQAQRFDLRDKIAGPHAFIIVCEYLLAAWISIGQDDRVHPVDRAYANLREHVGSIQGAPSSFEPSAWYALSIDERAAYRKAEYLAWRKVYRAGRGLH